MKTAIVVFLVSGLFRYAHAGDEAVRETTSEHLFQCGAAFVIVADVYRQTGNLTKSETYQNKFKTLAANAEAVFIADKKSKDEAEFYMQQHVDDVAAAAGRDADIMLSFVRLCDQRFP